MGRRDTKTVYQGGLIIILALAGLSGAGKDTAAEILVKKQGFTRMALADPLRELCARVFHIDFVEFSDTDKKDKRMQRVYLDFKDIDKIRDIVENEWGFPITYEQRERMEAFHGEEFDTPRDILRCIGTKLLRNCVRDDIWLVLANNKIREIGTRVVITDCRFGNERDYFKKLGAILALVRRGDTPMKEHEFDLGKEEDYDVVFKNEDTVATLQSNVEMWFTIRREDLLNYRVWKDV